MKKLFGTLMLCALLIPATLVSKKTKEEKQKIATACKQLVNGVANFAANLAMSDEGETNEDVLIESIGTTFCSVLQLVSYATRSRIHRSLKSYTIEELVEFMLEDPEILAALIKHLKQQEVGTA